MNSYRHELLVNNFKGIPVLLQHGNADDNVPAYHSRRMHQLISEAGGSSGYIELPGLGHWFDGVMTTEPLREFYRHHLGKDPNLPEAPRCFSIVVANPGDMGSRGGIVIDQLITPHDYGRIEVQMDSSSRKWILKTRNIFRFHFSSHHAELNLQIDTNPAPFRLHQSGNGKTSLRLSGDGSWQVRRTLFKRCFFADMVEISDSTHSSTTQEQEQERHGRQLGALNAVLTSHGRFSIVTQEDDETRDVTVQIARNLFQYFAADSIIVDQKADSSIQSEGGNVIRVLLGPHPTFQHLDCYPIVVEPHLGISVHDAFGRKVLYGFEEGLGAIFLRPISGERLEIIVWGFDQIGLRQAARLVPMLTGVGQPDFVIFSKRCLWTGAGGALAMGFLDHSWKVSRASYLT